MTDSPQKQCSRCKQFFPPTLEYFHADKSRPDGMRYECRDCFHQIQCTYREAGQAKVVHRSWRAAHKDRIAEWGKQDRQVHKARHVKKHHEYYLANKGLNRIKAHNRRTRIYQSKGNHTIEDVERQYQAQKGKCYYWHKALGKSYHV